MEYNEVELCEKLEMEIERWRESTVFLVWNVSEWNFEIVEKENASRSAATEVSSCIIAH